MTAIAVIAVSERVRARSCAAWDCTTTPRRGLAYPAVLVVVRWAAAEVLLRSFTAPAPLLRVVAPFSTSNPGPEASLRALGFANEHTLTDYRNFAGAPVDHRIFVLHNNPDTRAALKVMCAR